MAETPSTTALSSRLSRSANACQRCRRRKQKCDLKYPSCSSCAAAGVTCLSYHAGKQAEIPRNYVSNLEAEVSKLKSELEGLREQVRCQPGNDSPGVDMSPNGHMDVSLRRSSTMTENDQELVKSMGLVVLEPSNQPRFLGTSSGVTLAKIVMASIKCPILPSTPPPSSHVSQPGAMHENQSSLPPRHAANQIIDAYFEYRTPHCPVLTREEVLLEVERAYEAIEIGSVHHGDTEKSMCIAFLVFAIGLCGMLNATRVRPTESEGCFNSALLYLDAVFTYSKSDLESLSIILLLAQYVSLTPAKGSLWQLTGVALRLVVDMGLHWETDAIMCLDEPLLSRRRRLFWAAYRLDRLLAITLGRPFGIAELSTSVGLPNPYQNSARTIDMHAQRVANHLCTLATLESEIKHVLYHQLRERSIAYPRTNYNLWIRNIQPRLLEWKASVPSITSAHPKSIFACTSWWDAIYSNTLLFLHRPNPLVAQPPLESLRICFESSTNLIRNVKALQREHRIDVQWMWTHCLFVACLTLLYCIWHSEEIRNGCPADEITGTIQCGASTLAAMSERFPGAVGCRDVFETLSSVTMKRLLSPQAPLALGPEIESLQQSFPDVSWVHNLQLGNSMDDVFSMLSTDMYPFGDVLGATAQWPVEAAGELWGLSGNMEW